MAVLFSPWGNQQFASSGTALAVGHKIYTYAAGSSTALATYTDSTGSTAQTNPIILNSLGMPTNGQIWLTSGLAYKLVWTDASDAVIKTEDNITGVTGAASVTQWVASGITPTYISATSFTLPGDQTSTFHKWRRIQSSNTAGTITSTIVSSSYGALTTITVVNDSGVLDSGLSQVSYGLISAINDSVPRNLQPTSFRADNNNVNIAIPTGTWTRVAFSTERHDTNNEFASGTFTAKKALVHNFYAQWAGAAPIAGNSWGVRIYVNGAVVAQGFIFPAATASDTVAVATEVNLAIGDMVDMYVYHDRGSNMDLIGDPKQSFFFGGCKGA